MVEQGTVGPRRRVVKLVDDDRLEVLCVQAPKARGRQALNRREDVLEIGGGEKSQGAG